MKRSPFLRPLSDDHHAALVLARRARRAGEAAAGDVETRGALWREIGERFRTELEPHFRVEEERLLPALEAAGERDLVARTREDHADLRERVRAPCSPEALAEWGRRLERHVRFEERVLFPRAEAVLPEAALAAVERAAAGRPVPAAGSPSGRDSA